MGLGNVIGRVLGGAAVGAAATGAAVATGAAIGAADQAIFGAPPAPVVYAPYPGYVPPAPVVVAPPIFIGGGWGHRPFGWHR